MNYFKRRPRIGIVARSGILRVTAPPGQSWFFILVVLAANAAVAVVAYNGWAQMPLWLRIWIVWVIIGGVLALVYQLSVMQIIEFDALRLSVCKAIHGWEHKQEFQIADCGELEWIRGSEGRPSGLKCKVGWRTVMVGKDMLEGEAVEVLVALQTSLPAVAQKLCSYPNSKDRFITLGLGQ
jgi:hypothetical protein